MGISASSMFGVHEQVLNIRSQRAEVLAGNIANADTPGYKARELDFKSALEVARNNISVGTELATTNSRHINFGNNNPLLNAIKFRQSVQPDTGDGNTVDINTERMAYTQNSLEYQTTLEFLNGKINGLRSVIAGE
ncbi:MAG: flagellar basal body rod protein FlgB [Succinivibrionaceae bacterium]